MFSYTCGSRGTDRDRDRDRDTDTDTDGGAGKGRDTGGGRGRDCCCRNYNLVKGCAFMDAGRSATGTHERAREGAREV